jgi:DNA-binding XRE family transcriptional regulator
MKILPRILKIEKVESFKIWCLWTTGQVRINDFEPKFEQFRATGNERLLPLTDIEQFRQVSVSEGMTLIWNNILVKTRYKGELIDQPLNLDPDVLYAEGQPTNEFDLVIRVAYKLKELRLEQGLTQQQVAQRSGTTKNYISRLEGGKTDFFVSTVDRIFKQGLHKSVDLSPTDWVIQD